MFESNKFHRIHNVEHVFDDLRDLGVKIVDNLHFIDKTPRSNYDKTFSSETLNVSLCALINMFRKFEKMDLR